MKQHEPCRVSGLVSVAWSAEGLSLCGLIFVPRIEWSPTHLVAPWMPCFCPPGHALELPRFAEGSKAKTETAHWTAEVGQLVQFSVYCRLKSSMNWQAQQFSEMLCWLVVKQPLWKIWVHQLGCYSQLNGKIRKVPNHQPVWNVANYFGNEPTSSKISLHANAVVVRSRASISDINQSNQSWTSQQSYGVSTPKTKATLWGSCVLVYHVYIHSNYIHYIYHIYIIYIYHIYIYIIYIYIMYI